MTIPLIDIDQFEQLTMFSAPEYAKDLVSELNTHYEYINDYVEMNLSENVIDKELADSVMTLKEINQLIHCKVIYSYRHNIENRNIVNVSEDDFKLGTLLLQSIIRLLEMGAGDKSDRENLVYLGRDLFEKLYADLDRNSDLIYRAYLYKWLETNNLVKKSEQETQVQKKDFQPTLEEMENFYNKHKQDIYKHMICTMNADYVEPNPMDNPNIVDYYHYRQSLSKLRRI